MQQHGQHGQLQQLQAELAALTRHKQQLEAALARDTELAHMQSQRHQQAVSQLTQEAELLNGKLIKLRASRDDLQRELYGLKERKIQLLEDIDKLQSVEEQMISEVNALQWHKKALLAEAPHLTERARASAALALVYEHLRTRVIELSAVAPGALAVDAGQLDLEACALMAPRLSAALGPPPRPPSVQSWQPPPVGASVPTPRSPSPSSSAALYPTQPPGPPALPVQRSGSNTSTSSMLMQQLQRPQQQQAQPQQQQQPQQQGLQQQVQQQRQFEEVHPYLHTALAVTSQAMVGQGEPTSGSLPSSSSWSSQPLAWQGSSAAHPSLQPLASAPAWLQPPVASRSSSSSSTTAPMQFAGAGPSQGTVPQMTADSEGGAPRIEHQGSREHAYDMASLAALLQQHNLGDGEALRQLQQLMMQQQAAQGQQAGSSRGQQAPAQGAGLASYPPPKYKPLRVTAGDIASGSMSGSISSGTSGSTAGSRGVPAQQSAGKGPRSTAQQGAAELGQHTASEPLPTTAGMTNEQLAQLAAWGAEGLDTAALFKLHSM